MFEILRELTLLGKVIIVTILSIMSIAFIATLLIRKKYKKIEKDLDKQLKNESEEFCYNVLNSSLKDYKAAAELNPNEVNTQAIIEKNFYKFHKGLSLGERFSKSSVSIMIILGLLGTFYGLTLSIGDLVDFLSESASAEVLNSIEALVHELISSVQGMSVAFITSLFGIAASIVITIINILFNIDDTKESVMVKIEEYLDNSVALRFAKRGSITNVSNSADLEVAIGQELNSFSDSMEQKLKYVFDNLSVQLIAAAADNQNTVEGLHKSILQFEQSLNTFSENTRDFTEFNYNLRTNIERMDVSFSDLVQDLKSSTRDFAKGYEAMKELTKSIDRLSQKL